MLAQTVLITALHTWGINSTTLKLLHAFVLSITSSCENLAGATENELPFCGRCVHTHWVKEVDSEDRRHERRKGRILDCRLERGIFQLAAPLPVSSLYPAG